MTAKLLYTTKRAQNDLGTTVAFLFTRISKSDKCDWKKLRRLLVFVKGTINDKQIIGETRMNYFFI